MKLIQKYCKRVADRITVPGTLKNIYNKKYDEIVLSHPIQFSLYLRLSVLLIRLPYKKRGLKFSPRQKNMRNKTYESAVGIYILLAC